MTVTDVSCFLSPILQNAMVAVVCRSSVTVCVLWLWVHLPCAAFICGVSIYGSGITGSVGDPQIISSAVFSYIISNELVSLLQMEHR